MLNLLKISPIRSAAVGAAGIAPKTVFARIFGLEVPRIGFDEKHTAAHVKHDAADLAVAPAQPSVHRRVGIAGAIVVTVSSSLVVRFPAHERVLPELGLFVAGARRHHVAITAQGSVLNVGAQLVDPSQIARSVGLVERTAVNVYVLDVWPDLAALPALPVRITWAALVSQSRVHIEGCREQIRHRGVWGRIVEPAL